MNNSLLRRFGKYSYAIYVFHVPLIPIIYVGLTRIGSQLRLPIDSLPFAVLSVGYFLITAAVCFFVAWISWEVFEKHFLRLKRFF